MPRLKIICLAHPATWNDLKSQVEAMKKKLLELNGSKVSWLKLDKELGSRIGIYKIEKLDEKDCILAHFVSESKIDEGYPCIERILSKEGCLPENTKIPAPVPRASKGLLFFDLNEGVCYWYSPGTPIPEEKTLDVLVLLEKDAGVPSQTLRLFEWKEETVAEVTEVVRQHGYEPYKVKADLDTVTVTAEGDLDGNEQWKRLEGALERNEWKTVAYVKSSKDGIFIFGMTRRFRKSISIPEFGVDLTPVQLFEKILEIRELIEKALGCGIREYRFPEPISTLSKFV